MNPRPKDRERDKPGQERAGQVPGRPKKRRLGRLERILFALIFLCIVVTLVLAILDPPV